MKSTAFYREHFEYRFPVPLLAVERFYSLQAHGHDIADAVYRTLVDVCRIQDPVEEDVVYFLDRLQDTEDVKPVEKKPRRSRQPDNLLSRGSRFRKFMDGLALDQKILLMCGQDYALASRVYCETDKEVVEKMQEAFIQHQIETLEYQFEGVLYAMGGHLESREQSAVNLDTMEDEESDDLINNFFGFIH
jgi:hypothetical protein